jgi:hypothetical protein
MARKKNPFVQLGVRINPRMAEALDKYIQKMDAEEPYIAHSRSDAVRRLLTIGIAMAISEGAIELKAGFDHDAYLKNHGLK